MWKLSIVQETLFHRKATMGLIYSIGKDTRQIMDDLKDVLTLTFKIIVSVVRIVQDVENIVLELKDLSDMLHFSVNAVDRNKVNDRLIDLRNAAEEIGKKARSKHAALDLIAMVIEDTLKVRYKRNISEDSLNTMNEE